MLSAHRESVVKRNLKWGFCSFSLNQIKTRTHRKWLYTSTTAVLYGNKCHTVLLKFMLTEQRSAFSVQVKPTICLNVSPN